MRTFILAVTGLVLAVAACSSYGTSVVEVNKTPARVASVSVTLPPSLVAGQTARATATPKDAGGKVLAGRVVTWFTSSASVASVNDSGMIAAVAPGTAVVSAVSEGVAGQAIMAIKPISPTPIAKVVVAVVPSAVITGQTAVATATLQDSIGNPISGRVVTWASSNASVATVDTVGKVIATGPGTALIKASSEGIANSSSLSVSAPSPIPVAFISVSPASATMQVGASVQLSSVTSDANNNVLTGRLITWSSSNTGIATVSTSGLVTAIAGGSASITVASEGKTASAAIGVSAPAPVPVASVSVSPSSSSIPVGATVQLLATTSDASGSVLTGRVVTWSSSNSGVASVNSTGLVTAVSAGPATITATSETKTAGASFTVTPPPPPGSSNEPTGMTLVDERPFNSLAEHAAPHVPAWDTDTSLSIVSDATATHSPSNVLRATFPTGFAGGSSSGHTGMAFSGHRVLYIGYWVKYSANWWGHLTGVNKHGYAWANGNPIFVMETEAVGSGPMSPRMAIQGSPNSDAWYTPNLGTAAQQTITRNVWFYMEYVVVGNTAGAANGSMDFWLNGVHIGSYSGLQWTTATTSFDTFEFRPIWGGVGDVVPATMTLDMDHVYVSGKN